MNMNDSQFYCNVLATANVGKPTCTLNGIELVMLPTLEPTQEEYDQAMRDHRAKVERQEKIAAIFQELVDEVGEQQAYAMVEAIVKQRKQQAEGFTTTCQRCHTNNGI